MGNKNTNLERYLNLWGYFDILLEKRKIKLPSFAKNWDKLDFETYQNKDNPEESFLDKLKKMRSNKDTLTRVQTKSILQIESYIKLLDNGFVIQELADDETYESLFS